MKNVLLGIIFVFTCFGSVCFSESKEVKSGNKSIASHGISVGGAVSNGFVFIDGKYIDYPYVVSRRGLAVYINDELIAGPFGELETYDVENDPKIPEGVDVNSSFDDIRDYLTLKLRFLCTNRSNKNLVSEFVESIKQLPCVEKIDILGVDKIKIHLLSGESIPMIVRPPSKRSVLASKKNPVPRVEAMRANYEKRLSEGRCYIFNKEKGTLMMTKEKAFEVLSNEFPDEAEAVDTNTQRATLRLKGDNVPSVICKDLQSSTQLNERLKKEKKEKQEKGSGEGVGSQHSILTSESGFKGEIGGE